MSLRYRAIRSVISFGTISAGRYILSFTVQIVFARLLSPEAFGIVALSTTLFTLVGLLGRWGVGEAMMQDIEIQYRYSTIFWIRVAFAASVFLLVLFVAPLARLVYDGIVIDALLIFALSKGTGIAVSPLRGMVNKQFKLPQLALGKLVALVVSAAVGLALVLFQDETAWGLIVFYALQDVISAISIVVIASEYPSLRFNWEAARWFARFAWGMWTSKVTDTAENRLDDYLIGTIGGTVTLGIYSIAWRLTNAYTAAFQTAVTKGILPTFSRLKGHEEKSREGVQFLLRIQSYVIVPLYIFVSLNATNIIVLTFGSNWQKAGPVLGVLALAGILYPLVNTIRQYYYSVGETSIIVRVNVLILILMIAFISPAVIWYGAIGAAVSMNLVEVAALATFTAGLRSDLGVSIRETFSPPLAAGVVTIGAVLGSTILPKTWDLSQELQTGFDWIPPQAVTIFVSGTVIAVLFYGTLLFLATSRVKDDVSVITEAVTTRTK